MDDLKANLIESEWFKTRPPEVQALIREFPLNTAVKTEEGLLYLIGYTEGDELLMSPVDPREDYDSALEEKVYICASHLRGQTPRFVKEE